MLPPAHPHTLEPALFASSTPFPRFVDVAPELGLNSFDLSGGCVADDFDGDGDLDLITSTWDPTLSLHYYRNDGDEGFVERSEEAGFTGLYGGLNLITSSFAVLLDVLRSQLRWT